jgi:hypothetical protein
MNRSPNGMMDTSISERHRLYPILTNTALAIIEVLRCPSGRVMIFYHLGQGYFVTVRSMGLKAKLLAVSQVLLALKPLSSPAATISTSIVDLGYAQYQGSVDTATNIASFRGIRYAAPPIGESSSVCCIQSQRTSSA